MMRMRKIFVFLLVSILILSGCSAKEDNTASQDAVTILQTMLEHLAEHGEADSLVWHTEPDDVNTYLMGFYRLPGLQWTDAAIVHADGARAFELAVIFTDEKDAGAVSDALKEYLIGRQGDFTGYFPEEASLVKNALVMTRGGCVALAVCDSPETALSGFESCFGEGVSATGIPEVPGADPDSDEYRPDGRLVYVDPGIDDMTHFDDRAIVAAWRSGDRSGLSEEDEQVLDAAMAVLRECTDSYMSAYEIERAVYVWLTTHVAYDYSHYDGDVPPRSSYEPYGPLVNGAGVCLGYAETFRLLMDMAGIECITVDGASFHNRENHAWNMVRLDGAWYCVDPTWDHINVDGDYLLDDLMTCYNYFNVTSQHMYDTDHQWDYDNVPEAVAEDGGYF